MTPKETTIAYVEEGLRCVRNSLQRTRAIFCNYTVEQMQELHGDSGQTRQEVIDRYVAWEAATLAAFAWVKAQKE